MVGLAGKGKAREAAVAGGREQFERVPPLAPSGARLGGGLQDCEVTPLLGKEVARGEAGLASPDNDYVFLDRSAVGRVSTPYCLC